MFLNATIAYFTKLLYFINILYLNIIIVC